MPNPEEQLFANALNLIPAIGPVRLSQLFGYFGSYRKTWEAGRSQYVACGLSPKIAELVSVEKAKIDPSSEFGRLAQNGIEIILNNTAEYPDLLKEIPAAPPLIYARGHKDALKLPAIAVVGTRQITAYGKQASDEIVSGLVQNEFSIVSGLAYGVDAEALSSALQMGGFCIAVLASPLDDASISPKTNFQLAQKILKYGCLVSEYPLGASVQKQNFPVRNRIISGLALGTLVVEADLESGSLITANYALEQNRRVYAVPGSIFSPVSQGTNDLIKRGAVPVTSTADILSDLNLETAPVSRVEEAGVSEAEEAILGKLSREPVHIDELVRHLDMPAGDVNANLALLEMKGRVKNLGGAKFTKIR